MYIIEMPLTLYNTTFGFFFFFNYLFHFDV